MGPGWDREQQGGDGQKARVLSHQQAGSWHLMSSRGPRLPTLTDSWTLAESSSGVAASPWG